MQKSNVRQLMMKRYVKPRTLLPVQIPLLLKVVFSPFPCLPFLFKASSVMAEDPYVFYSTGSFTGREGEWEE